MHSEPLMPAELPREEMSSRWSAESVAQAWAPARIKEGYMSARVGSSTGEISVDAPLLQLPGRQHDETRERGPGLGDLKLVSFELPNFKDLGKR